MLTSSFVLSAPVLTLLLPGVHRIQQKQEQGAQGQAQSAVQEDGSGAAETQGAAA